MCHLCQWQGHFHYLSAHMDINLSKLQPTECHQQEAVCPLTTRERSTPWRLPSIESLLLRTTPQHQIKEELLVYPVVAPTGGNAAGRPPADPRMWRKATEDTCGLGVAYPRSSHPMAVPAPPTMPPVGLHKFEDEEELSPCPRMSGHPPEYTAAQLVPGCPSPLLVMPTKFSVHPSGNFCVVTPIRPLYFVAVEHISSVAVCLPGWLS